MDVNVAPDRVVLWFTLVISALAALVFGLAPLRNAVRVPVGLAMKTAAAASRQEKGGVRAGQIVVALQMSLCLMLLVGAGLLARTLRNLQNADLGLKPQGLLVFGVTPPQSATKTAEVVHFYQSLLDRVRTLPGVESATLMSNRLGSGWANNTTVLVDGAKPEVCAAMMNAEISWAVVWVRSAVSTSSHSPVSCRPSIVSVLTTATRVVSAHCCATRHARYWRMRC